MDQSIISVFKLPLEIQVDLKVSISLKSQLLKSTYIINYIPNVFGTNKTCNTHCYFTRLNLKKMGSL